MVAWAPCGHIVMPFTQYGLEAKASAEYKQAIATQLAPAVWCFTPFVAAWVEKLPENVWNAIRGWNDEYFGKQRSQLWTSRAAVVKEFVEPLGALDVDRIVVRCSLLQQRDCAAVQQCLRSDSHCEALSSWGRVECLGSMCLCRRRNVVHMQHVWINSVCWCYVFAHCGPSRQHPTAIIRFHVWANEDTRLSDQLSLAYRTLHRPILLELCTRLVIAWTSPLSCL